MSHELSDDQLEEYKVAFAIFDLDDSGFCHNFLKSFLLDLYCSVFYPIEDADILFLVFSRFLSFSSFLILNF